ncbi:hypothetical protein CLIB1423_02S02806 [[Candida] railenensis]|uniref:Arrestin-like N-terminal domain-containing protein n=1 Tax=[Candida] railenensis TaxID=45579 RepID=A0A9P0VVX3_9ASCO|nr:hypothetical protein CLIB1423_02S02806 [[Candida] railenensis]
MSSEVKIEIDRSSTGGTFTNYDIIRGNITLVVTSSITLNYIQVKLEGISKTQLTISKDHLALDNRADNVDTNGASANGRRGRKQEKRDRREQKRRDRERERDRGKTKTIQDVHKVLYDTSIVFPPENVRKVSNAKEFTLAPGNYSYPFEFKIPLNNSCIKMRGITNKLSFNKKTFDLSINNGNFNTNTIRNAAMQYLDGGGGGTSGPADQNGVNAPAAAGGNGYHCTSQLPPSLSGLGDLADIRYFIKVTCKRSSFIKPNLRSMDPFIFLPLDLDSRGQPINHENAFEDERREVFFRKEIVFKNRIPEIVGVRIPPTPSRSSSKVNVKSLPSPPQKKGFLEKFFEARPPQQIPNSSSLPGNSSVSKTFHEVNSTDVPFGFEIRFRHPAFLIPTKAPSFKLYLVSNQKPSRYSLAQYGKPDDSNGLGIVYMQKLKVEITCTTMVSVLETDGSYKEIHRSKTDKVIPICDNTYQNLSFDLKNSVRQRSSSATTATSSRHSAYELEIPKKYYSNCTLPDYLSPSFAICNVARKYSLNVIGGFSSEKVLDFRNEAELASKVKYVDLYCSSIKVLSGLNMTQYLHENNSNLNQSSSSASSSLTSGLNQKPPPRIHSNPPSRSSSSPVDSKDPEGMAPPMPQRPALESGSHLPTYDDVIRESSYQDDTEHLRARRRYQQHEQYYTQLD